ncbi:MAG TPA: VWA domain-containing protein [Tepidisphaeraceae bacterium]|nr:VWA domain-containing protein [Tepidisphaeraceae bacterium]
MTIPLPLAWLIDLEYMTGWKAALIFLALAAPVLWLGMRSMAGLGPVRKWVAIGLRLLVLLVLVLIVGGARWRREHKVLEVMVLRDISESTGLFRQYPGKSLQESVDDYLGNASKDKYKPSKDDRIGVISFGTQALVDAMPSTSLMLDARAIRDGGGATDIASGIQLALATFQRDAMRRMVLISDGNQTSGDLETALAAAVSQRVPIDVMKLNYNVQNEVLVERVSAPSLRRENDAFDVSVSLLSTNPVAVRGKLTLLEEGQPIEKRDVTIEAATLGADGKLEPRKHVERMKVPPLKTRAVRRFTAVFEPETVNTRTAQNGGGKAESKAGDTLLQNNSGSAFTVVRGQGRVLYVDASEKGGGKTLADALAMEGITVERVNIDQVPEDVIGLQNYDVVVLNNVPRGRSPNGADGLTEKHDAAIASYVHDFGGGLIMIGGPDSFGAGGWQGSKIEEVMPVNFDIPAQRQMPKGALVVIIHSCEMQDGNYWGEQCALKAIETLSTRDEIGVISFNPGVGAGARGIGGSVWDYELKEKGDGSRVVAAVKRMVPMDMPSFDDCLNLAVNGTGPNAPSLTKSTAAQKHIVIISDGDPAAPQRSLMDQIFKQKISISTISVWPHGGVVPPTMQQIAQATGGRYYGPIESNPSQLPQIFIKEATVVRRTLIQESRDPAIGVRLMPHNSEIMKGIRLPPPIFGFVLSAKKNNPMIEMPLAATLDGKKFDPLFAHWQAGLGKAAAFASDGANNWSEPWLTAEYASVYSKFWAQMVRGMSRPQMSSDFTVSTDRNGDKARLTVEATNKDAGFTSFLNFRAIMVDPENKRHDVKLLQTGPGTYVADFTTPLPGSYVVQLQYNGPNSQQGWLVAGVAVNDSPEMRELKSNDLLLEQIAKQTGGRVLPAFDAAGADLFNRKGLVRGSSPLPVWDILLPILMGLLLMDVACRRIAWDWDSTKKLAAAVATRVRQYTLTRKVETQQTLEALRKVREEVAETRFKPDAGEEPATPMPDRSAKFEAKVKVEGDLSQVVGGATNKPVPSAPKKIEPKGGPAAGGHTGSLLEAKRRAQQKIREKEQGE